MRASTRPLQSALFVWEGCADLAGQRSIGGGGLEAMSPSRPGRHGRSRMAAMLAGSVVLAVLAVASWCGAAFGAGVPDPRSAAFEPPVSEGGDFTTVPGTNFENGIPAAVVSDSAASS